MHISLIKTSYIQSVMFLRQETTVTIFVLYRHEQTKYTNKTCIDFLILSRTDFPIHALVKNKGLCGKTTFQNLHILQYLTNSNSERISNFHHFLMLFFFFIYQIRWKLIVDSDSKIDFCTKMGKRKSNAIFQLSAFFR